MSCIFHVIFIHRCVAILVHCTVPVCLGDPASPSASRRPQAGWCWWGAAWSVPAPQASGGQSSHWAYWVSLWDPNHMISIKRSKSDLQECHSDKLLMWNTDAFCEDAEYDVFVIFSYLKRDFYCQSDRLMTVLYVANHTGYKFLWFPSSHNQVEIKTLVFLWRINQSINKSTL